MRYIDLVNYIFEGVPLLNSQINLLLLCLFEGFINKMLTRNFDVKY